MAGNSQLRGAVRKDGTKKGPVVGSGGVRRRGLEGKGATPPAHARPHHPAGKRAATAARKQQGRHQKKTDETEVVLGRNPVLECLRAGVPATALWVVLGTESDERLTESVTRAADSGIAILEVQKHDLDRMSANGLHQGIALQVPPFAYRELPDVLAAAAEATTTPLLVALDGVTDPRNLGAVIRSAVAFGAHGVILPERRAASVTATAWRTSAGTAARIPVAQLTNLVRALKECQDKGYFVVGLDADGSTDLDDLEMATDPLVIVVGSEGRGLSRLVGATCDLTVSIPMSGDAESLNASVAAAVTLAEVARRRRAA